MRRAGGLLVAAAWVLGVFVVLGSAFLGRVTDEAAPPLTFDNRTPADYNVMWFLRDEVGTVLSAAPTFRAGTTAGPGNGFAEVFANGVGRAYAAPFLAGPPGTCNGGVVMVIADRTTGANVAMSTGDICRGDRWRIVAGRDGAVHLLSPRQPDPS